MSPGLMEENEHFSPGVDVYSFTMMGYEMVTGKVQFYEKKR